METNLRFKTSNARCGTAAPNVNPGSNCSYAEVYLLNPNGTNASFLQVATNESKSQSASITWTPGVYTLQTYLLLSSANKDIAEAWKGPIIIKLDN